MSVFSISSKKKVFLVLLALIFAGALFAQTTKAPEKTSIVLDWTINTNHTGLYVAMSKGFFKDAGLDVTIVPSPDSGAATLLAAGKVDFAFSFQEEILQSRANGVALTGIAAVIQNNTSAFMARKSSGITRPKDFEGKRYGGWGGPMEEAILKAVMKADGGDSSKVKLLSVGEMDFFAATEKTVDFQWVYEGWEALEAQVKGVPVNIIDLKQFSPALNYYSPLIATNQTFAQKKPEIVRAFLKALSKGYDFAVAHPDEAAAILLKAAPELDSKLVNLSQTFLAKEYKAQARRWGEFDPARWNGFFAWMKENKLIKDLPKSDLLFTNDFLPAP